MSISRLEFKILHRTDRGYSAGFYSNHIAYLAACLKVLDSYSIDKAELPSHIKHIKNKVGQEYLICNDKEGYNILLQGIYSFPIATFTAKILSASQEIVLSNSSIIHFLYMNRFKISHRSWDVWIPLSAIALAYQSNTVYIDKSFSQRCQLVMNAMTTDLVTSDYRWGLIYDYLQRLQFV